MKKDKFRPNPNGESVELQRRKYERRKQRWKQMSLFEPSCECGQEDCHVCRPWTKTDRPEREDEGFDEDRT